MLTAAANTVIRALLAPCCAVCDRPLDNPLSGAVCAICWRQWPLLTPPKDGGTLIEVIRSAGVYDDSLRHMIHALKYRKRRMIAPLLARRMVFDCGEALDRADAVVPVPMHWFRLWERGFNQADDIAMHLDLPVWRALRRRRHGPPQASLPAARRHGNASGAYSLAVPETLRGLRRSRLRGANVVLVDDVVTTGATLEACAEVLLDAGVARVTAVTAARAVAAQRLQSPPAPRLSLVRRR